MLGLLVQAHSDEAYVYAMPRPSLRRWLERVARMLFLKRTH